MWTSSRDRRPAWVASYHGQVGRSLPPDELPVPRLSQSCLQKSITERPNSVRPGLMHTRGSSRDATVGIRPRDGGVRLHLGSDRLGGGRHAGHNRRADPRYVLRYHLHPEQPGGPIDRSPPGEPSAPLPRRQEPALFARRRSRRGVAERLPSECRWTSPIHRKPHPNWPFPRSVLTRDEGHLPSDAKGGID